VGISSGGGSGVSAEAQLTPTSVGSVTVTSGGSGYTAAPSVEFSGGGGSGATATATLVSGTKTLGWDVENRLVSVTIGTDVTTFVYDGDGNRVMKTEGGETILYINKYYEKNLTTSTVTTSYYLSDRLVAQREGTELHYVHQDHLTGTSLMTDDEGNEISSIDYYPFGLTRSGDVPTDRKFTGQRFDDTGLYYYGARYYDPVIGRFISSDTMVPDPMNPHSFNRYSYCLNNPLKYIDPSGHWGQVTPTGQVWVPGVGYVDIGTGGGGDSSGNSDTITVDSDPIYFTLWGIEFPDVPPLDFKGGPLEVFNYMTHYLNAHKMVKMDSLLMEKISFTASVIYHSSIDEMAFSLSIDAPNDTYFRWYNIQVETIGVDAFHYTRMAQVSTIPPYRRYAKTFSNMPSPENIAVMRIHVRIRPDNDRVLRETGVWPHERGFFPRSIIIDLKNNGVGIN
jgi:RHS repeat-associated protein